jgi:hypothetical protein
MLVMMDLDRIMMMGRPLVMFRRCQQVWMLTNHKVDSLLLSVSLFLLVRVMVLLLHVSLQLPLSTRIRRRRVDMKL